MSLTLDLSRTPAAAPAAPVNLSGLTRDELREALVAADICPPEKARMRASQVWRWIHHYGLTDFAGMSDIGKDVRTKLAEAFTLARPEIVERQVSKDGTRKWLIRTAPGIEIETVYIPDVGLDEIIAHVLIHEIGHHFGLDDDQIHHIEDSAD